MGNSECVCSCDYAELALDRSWREAGLVAGPSLITGSARLLALHELRSIGSASKSVQKGKRF